MDPALWYEAMAREFYCHHFMMAPGKDEPAAMNSVHTHAERRDRWNAFLDCIGPVDCACIVSLWQQKEGEK